MQNPYLEMLSRALSHVAPLLPLFIFALVFVVALKLLEAKFSRKKRGRGRRRNGGYWRYQPRQDRPPDRVPDAADQLRTVMQADFKPQPLLNKSEARLGMSSD